MNPCRDLPPFFPFPQSGVKLVNAGKARIAYESKTHIEMAARRAAEGEIAARGAARVIGLGTARDHSPSRHTCTASLKPLFPSWKSIIRWNSSIAETACV
jgi:hypothetical protein